MDIRKFFGASPAANKAQKVGDKNGGTQRAKADPKTKKSEEKKAQKSPVSKRKSKGRDESKTEDNIVIDDSSDEDVIESSLGSSKSSNGKNKKASNQQKGDVKKRDVKGSHSVQKSLETNKRDENKAENKKSKESSKESKSKKENKEKVKEVDDSAEKPKRADSSKKSKDQSSVTTSETGRRTSPRKQKSVGDSLGSSLSKEKLKKENSNSSVEIVEESSDEETPVKRRKKAKSSSLKRKPKLFESDSEEDPLPQEKPKAKRRKNGSFVHDSDEEKKETALDKFVVHKKTPEPKQEKKGEVKKKTPVNLTDFFGGGSVSASRKERQAAPAKRKLEQEKAAVDVVVFDEEYHDDEDFLKTLDQLDGPEIKKVKQDEASPKAAGGSLASKLAEKVKSSKDAAQDTKESPKATKKSPSPPKKPSSPPKGTTTLKERKTYTMEVTKTKTHTVSKVKDSNENEEKTPPKKQTPSAPQKTSTKKAADDAEDDGFGLKTSNSFRAFKMRGGPLALGSKEIPEGEENCLEGLTFVITGVLDSIERDDAKSLIEKLGGRVTGSVSKKTSHVVVGREPGESKIKKANDLKVNQLDEDGLFDLIRKLPGKTSKYEVKAREDLKKEKSIREAKEEKAAAAQKLESFRLDKTKGKQKDDDEGQFTQLKDSERPAVRTADDTKSWKDEAAQPQSLLWVDKHKPTSLKQVIGQHGDKSNANKLLNWIRKWHENIIIKGLKASGNFFGGKGDGTGFRAALLSGPPGIGKTTTATLVCKEAGFSYVELNASDTRSKRSLKEVVAESLDNQTLVDYMGESKEKGDLHGQRHCLIMDEVDGMAGNEDRGGLQELVQLIKSSKIPVICICNDRNSMKMRTLANYCFDLRFSRPRVEQIKGAMMSLAFREGLKIPPAAVQEIILASNHDIRQVIHNLSMWSAGDKQLTYDQVKADAQKAQKDVKMGPFDVCRKVFVIDDETSKMSISDKSDLFFHDYSFGPLFVHENYPHVIPAAAKNDQKRHMACLARTIDSLCDGDLTEKRIRKEGNWNLLPIQAMYSSVIPGEYMRGRFPQMTEFPSWLGKNSSTGKNDRILQELNRHMHLQVSCDKRGLNLDYLPALRVRLAAPMLEEGSDGVARVIELMDDYDIVKDDFNNIMEITKWPHCVDLVAKLESKTKAAFTRQYNKGSHMTPYSAGTTSKKRKGAPTINEGDLLVEPGDELPVIEESEEEEDEPAVVAKPKAGTAKGKQTAAGKGKGKAKK